MGTCDGRHQAIPDVVRLPVQLLDARVDLTRYAYVRLFSPWVENIHSQILDAQGENFPIFPIGPDALSRQ